MWATLSRGGPKAAPVPCLATERWPVWSRPAWSRSQANGQYHATGSLCDDGWNMRGGLLRSWSGLLALVLLGACSNIIGISSYEIDPSLGEGGKAATGGGSKGGGPSHAGDATGGGSIGGSVVTPSGGKGGDSGGSNGVAGEGDGGQAGAPPSACNVKADCNDTIDCTDDTCNPDGTCTHAPDQTACTPAAGNCAVCTEGIGCVETPGKVEELLLDPGFDLKSGDWIDLRDRLPVSIVTDATAHTPGNSVRLGPVGNNATEQGFTDLSQQITIPKNAVSLVASGYFKLTPGTVGGLQRDANDDYATLTLFSLADATSNFTRYVDYNRWDGFDAPQTEWKAFSYTTSKKVLELVREQDVTLDLLTETWDSRFLFDSLSLKVTTCE